MASVSLRGVGCVYGNGVRAVGNIDLDVADGEFLVLVGPSGCGKTTLLRMIAGLEPITEGQIVIGNELMNDVPPPDRDVAMVFQNYALYPHMTVAENIGFCLKVIKTPRKEITARVRDVADTLEIGHLLDRKPKQLSGGQRQRVAMGRAIVRDPKAFLMDEPLSNLDAKLRVQMRVELAKIHKRLGVTTIYVTHDQVEAMTLGERVVVMAPPSSDRGDNVQQIGTPRDLYHHPVNQFVATFVGNPPMNTIPGRLTPSGFVSEAGTLELGRLLGPTSDVVAGLRPHDITLVSASKGGLRGVVIGVEHLGNETVVLVQPASEQREPLVVVLPGDPDLSVGAEVGCAIDPRRIHLFDAESGLRIDQAPIRAVG